MKIHNAIGSLTLRLLPSQLFMWTVLNTDSQEGSAERRPIGMTQVHRRALLAALIPVCLLALACVAALLHNWIGKPLHLVQDLHRIRRLDVDTPGDQILSLFPLRIADYIGFIATIIGLVLAAGGGIGGGGILVPIYILILRFPVKHAVSLSNVTVFGGGIANTLLNSRKRHPLADRPLISWDLLIMMEPLTMFGALVGADLNEFLPDVVVVILLVLLLSFTTYKTLKMAHAMHEKETQRFESTSFDDNVEAPLSPTLVIDAKFRSPKRLAAVEAKMLKTAVRKNGYGTIMSSDVSLLEVKNRIIEHERNTPYEKVFLISILFLCVIVINVLKGSGGNLEWVPLEIVCGTWAFFATEALTLIIILIFAAYVRHNLLKQAELKDLVDYEYVEGDIKWDRKTSLKYPALCSVAGLAAGLFGIGGGIVKGPLMLEMGVHPGVASATSACMILYTSFTATTSYMVYGEINYQYSVLCIMIGFVATVIGQLVMGSIIRRYNRSSYIAYCIGFVVAISALCMTLESIWAILEGGARKGLGFCTNSPTNSHESKFDK